MQSASQWSLIQAVKLFKAFYGFENNFFLWLPAPSYLDLMYSHHFILQILQKLIPWYFSVSRRWKFQMMQSCESYRCCDISCNFIVFLNYLMGSYICHASCWKINFLEVECWFASESKFISFSDLSVHGVDINVFSILNEFNLSWSFWLFKRFPEL